MRWPARLPKGSVLKDPVSHNDIFATAAAAAGAKLPSDRIMDSINLLPFIDKTATGRPHEALFWRTGDYLTVREGDWKLQVSANPKKIGSTTWQPIPSRKTIWPAKNRSG